MREIRVNTGKSYGVYIGGGLLDGLGDMAAETVRGRKAMLVCGSNVAPIYAERAEQSLQSAGFVTRRFEYPAGERSKNFGTLAELLECAAENELDGSDCFISLGGGVTGDLTGLAAALYKRGIACIQLPTTLLSMVDSSVGGKTAVNLRSGKNLAGVIRQPELVICDTDCLDTLPERVFNEGYAEIVKYAMLDDEIKELLYAGADTENIIAGCVTLKSRIVCADELDRGERRLLNFGHTVAHALEWKYGYELLHGEAVAIGMSVMTRGCEALGLCESKTADRLSALLGAHALPERTEADTESIMRGAREDKKRSGDRINLVLPERMGHCDIKECGFDTLERIINAGL